MRFGIARECRSSLGLESARSLDQPKTTHLEQIIVFKTCLAGVVTCNGTNKMQVVLDLTVPTPEALLVQMKLVEVISSVGRGGPPMASVPTRKCRGLSKTCTGRYKVGA